MDFGLFCPHFFSADLKSAFCCLRSFLLLIKRSCVGVFFIHSVCCGSVVVVLCLLWFAGSDGVEDYLILIVIMVVLAVVNRFVHNLINKGVENLMKIV